MYANGVGVVQSMTNAEFWLKKASDNHNTMARRALKALQKNPDAEEQFKLGEKYMDGTDVLQDDVIADYWFCLAAAQRHSGAQQAIEACHAAKCAIRDIRKGTAASIILKTKIYKIHMERLFKELATNNSVKQLSLNATIENLDLLSMAAALETNTKLEVLVLEGYSFSSLNNDKDFKVLCKSLEKNGTLKSLHFPWNFIGFSETLALAQSLTSNKALITLELRGSKICNKGLAALIGMLKINKTLQKLKLDNFGLDEDLLKELEIALKKNKSLAKTTVPRRDYASDEDILEEQLLELEELTSALQKNRRVAKPSVESSRKHRVMSVVEERSKVIGSSAGKGSEERKGRSESQSMQVSAREMKQVREVDGGETVTQTVRQRDIKIEVSARDLAALSDMVHKLESHVLEAQKKLALDPDSLAEQECINIDPKLIKYQNRLEMELNRLMINYFIASGGVLKLAENNNDTMIALIGSIPGGGPFLKILVLALGEANKAYQLYQINRLGELFTSMDVMCLVIRTFARQMTIFKQKTIREQKEIEYKGVDKLKGLYLRVKEKLQEQWKNLPKSDKTGVTLTMEDKLAMLDCAYLLQQILSGNFKIDKAKDLVAQFFFVMTGDVYKSTEAAVKLPLNPLQIPKSPVTDVVCGVSLKEKDGAGRESVATPTDRYVTISKVAALDFKIRLEAERTGEEIRKQTARAEAAEQESKRIAEELNKVKQQLPKPKSKVAEGRSQALALADPEAQSAETTTHEISTVLSHQAEQITSLTENLTTVQEKLHLLAGAVGRREDRGDRREINKARARLELRQFEVAQEREREKQAEAKKAHEAAKTKGDSAVDRLI